MDACRKTGEYDRSVGVAWDAAQSYSSFFSALQIFNCIQTSIYARQAGTEFQISHLLQLTLFLILGLTYQEVDDIVELDPHIVVIWK